MYGIILILLSWVNVEFRFFLEDVMERIFKFVVFVILFVVGYYFGCFYFEGFFDEVDSFGIGVGICF